jgi:hypothetical protein
VRRAEHIGDFSTNKEGNGHNTFKLIVQEAFSSTLINGACAWTSTGSASGSPTLWTTTSAWAPNSPVTPFDTLRLH